MKSFILPLLILPLLGASFARADEPAAPPLVSVTVRAVYAPSGFDDNDEAQVVLDGFLPNTCYRLAPNAATRSPTTGVIEVIQAPAIPSGAGQTGY